MRAYVFGAGASRGYRAGRKSVPPPLAKDFFSTFVQLPIAEDTHVLIGDIINYVRDTRGVAPQEFGTWNEDIESFLTEVHSKITAPAQLASLQLEELLRLTKAYSQMLFLFASVLNEVQDGPVYAAYGDVINRLEADDVLITFNWDTLLDRALWASGQWFPSEGYGIDFRAIFDDAWQPPQTTRSQWQLLKLHGSTNWLMPYFGVQIEDRVWRFNNPAIPPEDRPIYCYLRATKPYATYKNRYKGPYQPFAYYYYPPDIPIPALNPRAGLSNLMQTFEPTPYGVKISVEVNPAGKESMPVLIAPIKNKDYGLMDGLIDRLWGEAGARIRKADELFIIGYSFPPTDIKALDLLAQGVQDRSTALPISIINPFPDDIADRLKGAVGAKADIRVLRYTLEEYLAAA